MFKAWHIVLLVSSLAIVGCAEMDSGRKDLDTLTTMPEEQIDGANTTEETDEQPSSDDSAYDDAKKELSEAADAIEDLASEQKDDFVKEIDQQLKELDTSIGKMKKQASEAKEDARKELEEQLAEIETKREALLDRLEELSNASGNAWEDLREGVINAWDELKKARDDASSGIEVRVGSGVDVKVGDALTIDVGKDGTEVDVSPDEKSKDE